jgi:hypothetical protein
MKSTFKRTRLWIDPPLQLGLLLRLGLHLVISAVVLLHFAFLYEVIGNMPAVLNGGVLAFYRDFLARQAPMFVGLLAVLPIFLYDMVKFSHRFAGPLYRYRKTLEAMAAGKAVQPIKIRQPDLLRDWVPVFNTVIWKWNEMKGVNTPPVLHEDGIAEMGPEASEPAAATTSGAAS